MPRKRSSPGRKTRRRRPSRRAAPNRKWRIGIADTTFARFDMAASVLDQFKKIAAKVDAVRYTVPGFKDLPLACKKLIEERRCDAVIALGMAGRAPIDQVCAHEASLGLGQVQLSTNRHIIECFVHTPEARDDLDLARLMDQRAREHAENVYWILENPSRLRRGAGRGLRQGRPDEGPIRPDRPSRAGPTRIAIVWSEFNGEITQPMLLAARDEAEKLGLTVLQEVAVPGAFEIPSAVKHLLDWSDADAIVAIGAVIKGETKHDELVVNRAAEALVRLSLEYGKPVALGITGPGMTWEQARERIPHARRAVQAAAKQVGALREARMGQAS